MLPYSKRLKHFARRLRRNMTDAEKLIWMKIRRKQLKGVQFYRQRIIGEYIVDFYCPKANLVIEIDGGSILENNIKKDKARTDFFKRFGLKVIRFTDKEVFENPDGVIQKIYESL
ncbi:MAG: DUF559 domain-containing protein [candidate division WOR-3 bacterium]